MNRPCLHLLCSLLLLAGSTWSGPAFAAAGEVLGQRKVSATQGGFGGALSDGDRFGSALAPLGDLDGDGVDDVAVGVYLDDDGGTDRGAVWVLFLNADGTVKDEQKISSTAGGFGGTLDDGDEFGAALAALGDLDGDGRVDLAVGAPSDGDGGAYRGAVWVLFLNADGTVKGEQKISDTVGGFGGVLADEDFFGSSLAALPDLDGDGVDDLAVGAPFAAEGGLYLGAVWVLFLKPDGSVESEQKISPLAGGFGGVLADFDSFGWSLASLGDLDGDGPADLAVGASTGFNGGAVWVLFLDTDGTVKAHQKISDTDGGFGGAPGDLGWSLALLGDLDSDGVRELAVGAVGDDDGGSNRGAVWVLFMTPGGIVKSEQKISSLAGGFTGALDDSDNFGFSVAPVGDVDGDGVGDLAVGAYRDDDGGANRGAVWTLELSDARGVTTSSPSVPALQGPALFALVLALGGSGWLGAPRRRPGQRRDPVHDLRGR